MYTSGIALFGKGIQMTKFRNAKLLDNIQNVPKNLTYHW